MIKPQLKEVLHRLGYNLEKLPKKKIPMIAAPGFPIKVECVGPSGVGKSTLVNELFRSGSIRGNWVAANKLVIYDRKESAKFVENDVYSNLMELFTEHILSQPINIRRKIALMRYYLELIQEEEQINYLAGGKVVVFHEGIFHNGTDSIMALERNKPDSFKYIIQGKAVINCTTAPDILIGFIKKRKAQGVKRGFLENQNDADLQDKILKNLGKKRELVSLLLKHNVPVLEIDTAQSLKDNVNKVIDFIDNLTYLQT